MLLTQAPTLSTDRLVLRAHAAEDLAALTALWADPDVVRHIGGRAATPQECWFRLLRYQGLWPVLGFGYWAVCDRATGTYLGDAGLARFQRGFGAAFDAAPEMGWAFAPQAWGRGIATEAGAAIVGFADRRLAAARTVCVIDTGNAASIAVAAKLGFSQTNPATDTRGALYARPLQAQNPAAGAAGL
jgi:RimJ/RimL family protein N-acetyltransferase